MKLVEEIGAQLELPYKVLYNQQLDTAMDKLLSTDFDGATAYNIKKLWDGFGKSFKVMQTEYKEILKAHAMLDEKGEVITPENDPGAFKIKEGEEVKFNEAVQALMDKTFFIPKVSKLNFSQLMECPNLKLSSKDLVALEPVLDGLDMSL